MHRTKEKRQKIGQTTDNDLATNEKWSYGMNNFDVSHRIQFFKLPKKKIPQDFEKQLTANRKKNQDKENIS